MLEIPKLYIFRYIRKNVYLTRARLYIFLKYVKKCIVFRDRELLFMDESGKNHCQPMLIVNIC